MDVGKELRRINKVQPLQHSACISCIAIGENHPPPRQCTDIGVKFRIRRYALQRNVMNKVQKCVRISAVMMHQARERGPMLHEITLLHPPRLLWITTKQPLNELAHFDVDQAEKVRLRWIEQFGRASCRRVGKGGVSPCRSRWSPN